MRVVSLSRCLLALCLVGLLGDAAAGAAERQQAAGPVESLPHAVPGELVVRYEPSADASDRSAARRQADVEFQRGLRIPRAQLLKVDDGQTVRQAIAALERRSDVSYAEPNWIFRATATPNDPSFGSLWGLHNTGQSILGSRGASDADIDAPEGWELGTGGPGAVVAVVDTGVAYDHPDLEANMWSNPGEIAGNNVDDDGNGVVDDVRGWDVVDGDNDPRDFTDHGTHVAGTIGAVGDNAVGIAGVAWSASIMPVRVLGTDGSGTLEGVAKGFDYAGDNGASIVNASLGGGAGARSVQLLKDVIDAHRNTLFVVAAGNDGADNDIAPQYPCNITSPNLICVAATTQTDSLAGFSNYGATSVDIGAPGTRVLSTLPATAELADTAASDGFEGSLATKWTTGGTGGSFAATSSPSLTDSGAFPGPYEGTQVLDDEPTANDDYTADENYWVQTLEKVDLRGRAGCALTYAIRWDLDRDRDRLLVETSPDGRTWTSRDGFTGFRPSWYAAETALGSDGQQVHVRFRVDANAGNEGGFSYYDGVQIDDVGVRCIGTSYSASDYGYLNGTSMAAPQVAGAATVLAAAHPGASSADLRGWLLGSGDAVSALSGKTVTGSRLNLHRALAAAAGVTASPTAAPAPAPAPAEAAPAPAPAPTAQPETSEAPDSGVTEEPPPPDEAPAPVAAAPAATLLAWQPIGALRLRVTCTTTCAVRAKVTAVKSLTRILGKHRRVIASRRAVVDAGSTVLKVRVGRRAFQRLQRAGVKRAKAVLRVSVTDAAGQVTRTTRLVRIKIRR